MPKRRNRQLCPIIFFAILICSTTFVSSTLGAEPDYSKLAGEWVRPDGGYVLRIQNPRSDGTVAAAYFNPGEIHVAEANVSLFKGLTKLFVKLQDKGYPGSTYTLYYYDEKDALAGFYYQAVQDKTYQVVFMRNSQPKQKE